ncbi:uncharacterized protein LOC141670981 isoform X2 [Apium graveolens]|uniref:uncharacterized protein LOC141670981 isoform X2 n=1 Tax=Apium graveolens TaxID=4045 RepID=UPI003D7BDF95
MGCEANAVQVANGEVKMVKVAESGGVPMGSEANAVQVANGEVKMVKVVESGGVPMGSEANAVQVANGEVKMVKVVESGVPMGSKANAVQVSNGAVKMVKVVESGVPMGSEANAVQVANGEVKMVKVADSGLPMGSEADAVQLGNGEVKALKLEEIGVLMGSEADAVQVGNGKMKTEMLEESGVTMGSEANAVQLGNGVVNGEKLEEGDNDNEAKNVVKHSLPPMKPGSPDARDEGINVPSDFTLPDASSPITPKGGSFDPFAPAIDDLAMAPRGSSYSRQAWNISAGSIKLGSSVRLAIEECCDSDEEDAWEDERLLKVLYYDLLEVIVSTQVYSVQFDMFLDEVLEKLLILDGYRTPEPLFTGIADTCPPAPMKFERKAAINITDRGLCRKLEF